MKPKLKHILLTMALFVPGLASAQDTAIPADTAIYLLGGFVLLIAILVLIVASVVLQVLRTIVRQDAEKKAALRGEILPEPESFWSRFLKTANDAVPIEEEETVLLDHNYDGIQELDNHLPPWWKWLFYVSIVFGVVYMIGYHVMGLMPLSGEEYNQEIAQAEALKAQRVSDQPMANIDETSVTYLEDATALASGKQVFDNNCVSCHRADGGGNIGPNLTDEFWLHGGSISDIFSTIKHGVPQKGMISWEPVLSPEQMQNVASYIMSIGGTNPPNPKAPEGERYNPENEGSAAADSVTVALN